MNTVAFDAVTRRTAVGVSRRGALMKLAGAGFAAALARPVSVAAKKNDAKKAKKKAKQKCRSQIGQCTAWVEDQCESGDCTGEAVLHFNSCCQLLGQCDSRGFLDCISS